MANNIQGQQGFSTASSEYNAAEFQTIQRLLKVNTCEPVKVVAVDTAARMVDVLPLVRIVAGGGDAIDQSQLYRLPYLRIQGGANAVIIDPHAGDVGIALYAMRDVSAFKAQPGQTVNPGSARTYDKGDGFYLGGFLNQAPQRFVRVTDAGVEIEGLARVDVHGDAVTVTSNKITLDAPLVEVTGTLRQSGSKGTGASSFTGGFTNTGGQIVSNGVTLETHTHGGVETGGGSTGGPN